VTLDHEERAPPPAVDRKELAKTQPERSGAWPRTDRRVARLQAALRRRQPDLTIVLENVHDIHNLSAVLRSCDAVGIQTIHLVYTIEEPPREKFARRVAAGTAKWVDTVRWRSIDACFASLRAEGKHILATGFTDRAVSLYDANLTVPVAIVFGNEMRGLTPEAIAQSDGELYIPIVGMVQSLNISVSCAVTLYEAFRQRLSAGAYDQPALSEAEMAAMLDAWLER
jgi:tRNA (guanosine-2'-O-)-methyltransferase